MNKKVLSVAFVAMAAMTLCSCGTSKNAQSAGNKSVQVANNKSAQADDNQLVDVDAGNATPPCEDMTIDPGFGILSDAERDIVKRNNTFALNLYQQLSGMDSKVVSPMSITYLMGMLANGADGATQQEILKAIGCEGVNIQELNALYHGLMQTAGHLDKKTTVKIANYIAVNKQNKLNPDFAQTVSNCYQAGVESLDFSSSKSTARINNWCKDHTDGMIPKIIDQVDPSAVSYIMNAIYFNGTWQEKFDAKNTKQENFRGYTRDIQKVNMMHQVAKFFYTENDTFKAVDLPYGNGIYRMTVLLPNEGKSIDDMMKGMTADKLENINRQMENCMVNLKLPKFTTEMELPLNSIISKLGAPSMFLPSKANFSHFADGNFFVSKMLQKAKIEVSEQGTKAAAVTAAVMLTSMAPMEVRNVEFHADRPFVYLITDTNSGAILFMGQFTGNH